MNRDPEDLYGLVDNLYDAQGDAEPADEKLANRPARTLAVGFLLATIGSGSAFLWRSYDSAISAAAAGTTSISQLMAALQSVQQSQRAIAADVRQNQEALEAQQANIKRLSEVVSRLNAELVSIQSSVRDTEAVTRSQVRKLPPRKAASKSSLHEPAPRAQTAPSPEEKP